MSTSSNMIPSYGALPFTFILIITTLIQALPADTNHNIIIDAESKDVIGKEISPHDGTENPNVINYFKIFLDNEDNNDHNKNANNKDNKNLPESNDELQRNSKIGNKLSNNEGDTSSNPNIKSNKQNDSKDDKNDEDQDCSAGGNPEIGYSYDQFIYDDSFQENNGIKSLGGIMNEDKIKSVYNLILNALSKFYSEIINILIFNSNGNEKDSENKELQKISAAKLLSNLHKPLSPSSILNNADLEDNNELNVPLLLNEVEARRVQCPLTNSITRYNTTSPKNILTIINTGTISNINTTIAHDNNTILLNKDTVKSGVQFINADIGNTEYKELITNNVNTQVFDHNDLGVFDKKAKKKLVKAITNNVAQGTIIIINSGNINGLTINLINSDNSKSTSDKSIHTGFKEKINS